MTWERFKFGLVEFCGGDVTVQPMLMKGPIMSAPALRCWPPAFGGVPIRQTGPLLGPVQLGKARNVPAVACAKRQL
jgi:hypothetical protein